MWTLIQKDASRACFRYIVSSSMPVRFCNMECVEPMRNDDMAVVWTFAGSLITVKLLTSLLILYHFPSWHTLVLVLALSVVWFVPPFYYFSRHSQGHFRLLRGRARRNELLRQEWEVDEPAVRNRS